MKKVAIVGGGLAGIIAGIELLKKGVPCFLFEKKTYPFHRVCGEYVSNEAVPYLKKNELFPDEVGVNFLTEFQLTSVSGESATMPLDLGGFGISRYKLDDFLIKKAQARGLVVHENEEVDKISFVSNRFLITTNRRECEADVVIGAFGKRSKLDHQLKRNFIKKRSPYVGVKYHIQSNQPGGLVSLHNFEGGYCGVSNIEEGFTNVCYLVHREVLQRHGNVEHMEHSSLRKNPWLDQIFEQRTAQRIKPLVINEISFETKTAVDNHILMAGDAAGMITPLCGNGMAMAIHGGMMAGSLTADFCTGAFTREQLERAYGAAWRKSFQSRLQFGRIVQRLFGNTSLSAFAVNIAIHSKPISRFIMRNTHGQVF